MKVLKLLAIIFLLVSCLITTGNPNAQAEVTVYDADGQFLGIFLGYYVNSGVDIYSPSDNIVIGISQSTGEISEATLYFENANCQGIAYIDAFQSNRIVRNSGTYYVGEKIAPSSDIQFKSALQPWDSSCVSFTHNRTVVPAFEVYPSITLPVTLPLNLDHEPAHHGKWKK